MTNKLRVAYFTSVGLTPDTKNGGSICCRNHLERIAADPSIECHAVLAGPESTAAASLEYASSIAETASYFSFEPIAASDDLPFLTKRWPYLQEADAWRQSRVADRIVAKLADLRADVIVVDYLYSAQFAPRLFQLGIPVVTITLNREGDFFRDLRERGYPIEGRPATKIAELRLRWFEKRTYSKSAAVVSIGAFDTLGVPSRKAHWVSPYLDRPPQQWTNHGKRSLFFVGSHHHYPNRKAIEWLATQFWPALTRLSSDLSLNVLGMSVEEAPEAWRLSGLHFLGYGNDETARGMFLSDSVLIAPIENDFGAKFKITEAIAYGTPILASRQAMSGVSFLPSVPRIDLNDPESAAATAVALFDTPSALDDLHRTVSLGLDAFASAQIGAWGRLLRSVQ